ncbi:MAG: hypothetical protein IPK16_02495 [Anaerolineales bacterium]|nr:hypothetical protein [Anaerolineales bacterium]
MEALLRSTVSLVGVVMPGANIPGVRHDVPIQALLPKDAIVLDNDPHALPVVSPFAQHSILHLAWAKGIPLFAVNQVKSPETAGVIRTLGPHVGCVACFPRRIPPSLLKAPRRGFLNVHPSLLPEYRGPSPLFWQFRAGEMRTGVTVHWMDAEFDTGPIAAQRSATLPDGITETDATVLMARAGAQLLTQVLDRVADGEIPYHKQPPGGSTQPYPQEADFSIDLDWSAHRIYNFMRATAVWGYAFTVEVDGAIYRLTEAISWSPYGQLGQTMSQDASDTVLLQCNPGVVLARFA